MSKKSPEIMPALFWRRARSNSSDKHSEAGHDDQGPEGDAGRQASFDLVDPILFVQQCLDSVSIEFRFDGSVYRRGTLLKAETPNQVEEYLDVEHISIKSLKQRIVLFSRKHGYPWKSAEITPALEQICERSKHFRLKEIALTLKQAMPATDHAAAEKEWMRMSALFPVPREVSMAALQHFIWQVKQKAFGREIEHHLMPLIWSSIQGPGKSTFVRRFISPIQELCARNVVLRQVADDRSAELFRYLIIVVDDMERLKKKAVSDLKAVMTGDVLNRRKLATSNLATIKQKSTLIGTANSSVSDLVPDNTGHRRFIDLPFVNGNVAKGGDPAIWPLVMSLDYALLWRSVDAFAPSPILPVLRELYEYQDGCRPKDPLLAWLLGLDVLSEAVRAITVREGIRADRLRLLYQQDTGQQISHRRFPEEMAKYFANEETPFADEIETKVGMVYRLKPQFKSERS